MKKEKNPTKKQQLDSAKKMLEEVSHEYIRDRSCIAFVGTCIDCRKVFGKKWIQCGHFIPDRAGNILLRYHPHNMQGQFSGCNMKVVQERVKINYTLAMVDLYGREYVNKLISMIDLGRGLKVDLSFYETMIELYKKGDEKAIVNYLESLCQEKI